MLSPLRESRSWTIAVLSVDLATCHCARRATGGGHCAARSAEEQAGPALAALKNETIRRASHSADLISIETNLGTDLAELRS